jgi:uncharacterized protein (TIGR02246 family)
VKTLGLLLFVAGMLVCGEGRCAVPENEIEALVHSMVVAWDSGDAAAFSKHFGLNGTFTNVNGTHFDGRAAFEERHRAIFAGPFKGSTLKMVTRRTQLIRPDVAIVDVDCEVSGGAVGQLQTRLLLVLSKESDGWSIAAYHNTAAQQTPLIR